MNIYLHTLAAAGLTSNAQTVGGKALYALCTVLAMLDSDAPLTDPSAAQSVLNRLLALGIVENSTVMAAMRFELSQAINAQRQGR